MARIILLAFTLIMLSGCIVISDVEINDDVRLPKTTPIQTIAQYVEDFNNMDLNSLNDSSGSPFFWLRGDDRDIYEQYEDSVDFEGLKSKGWSYSKINSLELVYEDNRTAIVYMNFSRYNASDEIILTADANYLLVNNSNEWRIKGGFAPNKVTTGKD